MPMDTPTLVWAKTGVALKEAKEPKAAKAKSNFLMVVSRYGDAVSTRLRHLRPTAQVAFTGLYRLYGS